MYYEDPVKALEKIKKNIERDIEWWKKPNRPGVSFTDAYRKERIAELTKYFAEYRDIVALLTNDRFKAIEADLIRFACIEANIVLIESMVKKIGSKHPNMKSECLDAIKDIQRKYFEPESERSERPDN